MRRRNLTLAVLVSFMAPACMPRAAAWPDAQDAAPGEADVHVHDAANLDEAPAPPPGPADDAAMPEPEPRPLYSPLTGAIDLPAPPPRELRGVWIAAVSNIDWPSRRELTTAQQQAELIAMLDEAVRLNLNTVILHVRPAGDALYVSHLEPWSEYLTGQQGRAPEPFYDPLAFAIEQAHARGLELHAWFNPFRARHPSARSTPAANHITRRRPELVRTYGTHLWMDPSEPEVREHALRVILDVVRRYDIDGVHIDDYFYPYQERDRRGRIIPFPDDRNYERYRANGGRLARDDWRRSHVDGFVHAMYEAVKQEKRWVKVGISPFGIWRPGYPESVRGLDAYRDLYADARKWLNEGWLDYMVPQLYWPAAAPQQPYTELLSWWISENHHNRLMVAGNIPNRVGTGPRDWQPTEVLQQVRLTRAQPGAAGNVHFSMRTLIGNRVGMSDALREHAYATPVLVPASPWLGGEAPPPPTVRVQEVAVMRALELELDAGGTTAGARPAAWLVQQRSGGEWRTRVLPGHQRRVLLEWEGDEPPELLVVRALSRTWVEGEPLVLAR